MTQLIKGYPCAQSIETKYSPNCKKQITQQTILIPGGGCTYYRAMKGDACTFCAFPSFTREVNKGLGNENFFGSWKLDTEIYKEMFTSLTSDNLHVERLAIFNGGSFFPNAELPIDFQQYVYQHVANHSNLKQLFVEAYPRFINQQKLESAIEQINGKDLLVGIGLESRNDIVRNVMLKKGIDLKLFESKVRMMQILGVQTSVYVFLKAPQLTEWQAYQDVLSTLRYLHDLGIDEIELSCAFVPKGTLLENMYIAGEFRPPWLWTIYEIAQHAENKGWPLNIGGFEDTPPPIAGPSNCSNCNETMLSMFEYARQNGKLPATQLPNCTCKYDWKNEMKNSTPIPRII